MQPTSTKFQEAEWKPNSRQVTLFGVALVGVASAGLAFLTLLAGSLILLVPQSVVAAGLQSGNLLFFQDLLGETLGNARMISAYVLVPWLLFCLLFGAIGISRLVRKVEQAQSAATPVDPDALEPRLNLKIMVWSGLVGAPLAVALFLGLVYFLLLASILSSSGFPDPLGFFAKSIAAALALDAGAILAGWLICRLVVRLMYQPPALPWALVNALCLGAGLVLALPIFWSALLFVAPSAASSAASALPNFGPRTDDSAPRVLYQKPGGGEDWYFGEIKGNNEQRVVKDHTDVTVSPTGKALAFAGYCGSPPASCILVSDIDGRNIRQLEGVKGEPEGWSPDGCKIVGSYHETIFIVDRDGLNYREIANGTFPQWMSDGQGIVYRNPDNEMYVVRADGTGNRQLVDGKAFGVDVSPDGAHISYLRQPGSLLYVLDLESGSSDLVANGSDQDWSPDGEQLIYASDTPHKVLPTLTIVNRDGSAPMVLPVKGRDPHWSPDGTLIVYDTYGSANPEIHLVKADGSGDRKLADGYFPRWVPVPNDKACD